jgi:flagellin
MFVIGVNTANSLRLARYTAQALDAVDRSSARIAANRRFTSFAEDTVAATREVSMRAQLGATGLYLRSAQDAAAAADAASAGLQSASDILIELRNAVLALDPSDAHATQQTVSALTAELTRLSRTTTSVGGRQLLDGSLDLAHPLTFTVAPGGGTSSQVGLTAISLKPEDLGMSTGTGAITLDQIDFESMSPTDAAVAIAAIEDAQKAVNDSLVSTAAVSSAMGFRASALGAQAGALDSALDNLVGVDVAQESVALARNRIRAEAATSMMAQANALQAAMIRQLLMSR